MKDKFIKKLKRSWLAIWIAFAAAAEILFFSFSSFPKNKG